MHPLFVECYAVQAFSLASDLDAKLMAKEKNQIPIRNVCAVNQPLLRHPSHHSGYGQDRESGTHLHFYLCQDFQPISFQLEAGTKPLPEDVDGSVAPVEGSW